MLPSRALLARNLFDVVKKLPNTGIGSKLQRKTWPPESYWTITAVRPTVEGNHGKAWGIFTWKGAARNDQPTRVRGTLKKVWRMYENPTQKMQWQRLPSAAPGAASTGGGADAEASQAA